MPYLQSFTWVHGQPGLTNPWLSLAGVVANDFTTSGSPVASFTVFLSDADSTTAGVLDGFSGTLGWGIYADDGGAPGTLLFSGNSEPVVTFVELSSGNEEIYRATAALASPIVLAAGTYWFGVHDGAWGEPSDGAAVQIVAVVNQLGNPIHSGSYAPTGWTGWGGDTGLLLTGGPRFAESAVNTAPQVIDGSASFGDLGNPDGAVLTVSGLLAEDLVSIAHEGTAAGQIGVSGSEVSYGGVPIGSFTGGAGATFTVTFNAAASDAAIDRLIERLAYANASDAPTELRTLTLDFVEAGGARLPAPVTFAVAVTPEDDPLVEAVNTGITVDSGETTAITGAHLDFDDPDVADDAIVYTVTLLPDWGTLLLDGVALGVGGSFTQADIAAGRLAYANPHGNESSFELRFSVSDGAGATLTNRVFAITVAAENDAPSVTGVTLTLEEDAFSFGLLVSTILSGRFSDPDGAGLLVSAIAIAGNAATAAQGVWQYSTDSGTSWHAVGTVSADAALVLDDTARLKFVPAADYNGSPPGLVFHGIDNSFAGGRTSGATRVTIDTAVRGGTTAISDASATIGITVTPVNDAPSTANVLLAAVDEDATDPAGQRISDIYAAPGRFTDDDDPAATIDGLAIRANTATTQGEWQYSTDDGATWFAVGTVSSSSRLILDDSAMLRFVPAPGYTGSVPQLGVSGIDSSYAGGFTSGATRVLDNSGQGGTTPFSVAATIAIQITPVDDAPTAVADSGTVAENATVAIDVDANDTDPDGGAAPRVVEIDGQAATVGVAIALASGATAMLNANGTITYNPNGKFNWLISSAQAAATGATNVSALDSFEYTLDGGSAAAVAVTVTGVAGLGDRLAGSAGGDSLTGTAGANLFMLHAGGSDTASGGGGEDGFYMGTALDPGDVIDGGTFANTFDQLGIQGNYVYTFSATNLTGIEILVLLSGRETSYGDDGLSLYTYDLTTIDANVAAGQTLTINGNQLYWGEDVRFDGSAETDGSFRFQMSGGDDVLIGGAGNDIFNGVWGQDTMTGGGGEDIFNFLYVTDSAPGAMDAITDFTAGDRINLSAIDASTAAAGNQAFAFIGSAAFGSVAGQLRVTGSGTDWLVEVDVNGDGVADLAIDVTTTVSGHGWSGADFVL